MQSRQGSDKKGTDAFRFADLSPEQLSGAARVLGGYQAHLGNNRLAAPLLREVFASQSGADASPPATPGAESDPPWTHSAASAFMENWTWWMLGYHSGVQHAQRGRSTDGKKASGSGKAVTERIYPCLVGRHGTRMDPNVRKGP